MFILFIHPYFLIFWLTFQPFNHMTLRWNRFRSSPKLISWGVLGCKNTMMQNLSARCQVPTKSKHLTSTKNLMPPHGFNRFELLHHQPCLGDWSTNGWGLEVGTTTGVLGNRQAVWLFQSHSLRRDYFLLTKGVGSRFDKDTQKNTHKIRFIGSFLLKAEGLPSPKI